MNWLGLSVVAVIVQMVFLIPSFLVGCVNGLPRGFEIAMAEISKITRWTFAPASLVLAYSVYDARPNHWLIGVVGALIVDGFCLATYWNEGSDALTDLLEGDDDV